VLAPRNELEPVVTTKSNCCCSPAAIVGTMRFALPKFVPTARPVNAPKPFAIVYERATGTPVVALGITSGLGETVAPSIDAVIVYGAKNASDVRRASTVNSQTPGNGSLVVRLVGLPVLHAPAEGE